MVYGARRDNELQPARGDQHPRMFSLLLLAVFVAAFTLLFGNFVIPSLARRSTNSPAATSATRAQLQHKGFIHRGKAARTAILLPPKASWRLRAALREKHFEVAKACTTARQRRASCNRPQRGIGALRGREIRALRLRHARQADRSHPARARRTGLPVGKQAERLEQQQIGPIAMPLPRPPSRTWPISPPAALAPRALGAPALHDNPAFSRHLTRTRYTTGLAQRLEAGRVRLVDDYQHTTNHRAGVRAGRDGLILTHGRSGSVSQPEPPHVYEAERIELTSALPTIG